MKKEDYKRRMLESVSTVTAPEEFDDVVACLLYHAASNNDINPTDMDEIINLAVKLIKIIKALREL